MSTVLENINDFWISYGQWIGLALIPTIITGLTLSASTAKAGPVVQKIWDGFKMVMDFLSVVTHKDKMGTFKLPVQTSAAKDVAVKAEIKEAKIEEAVKAAEATETPEVK